MVHSEVINNLVNDGAFYRCQGIIECLEKGFNDQIAIEAIGALKSDDVVILGRKVSSYAKAALDILGAEKYEGQDEEVIQLITDLLERYSKNGASFNPEVIIDEKGNSRVYY